MRNTQRPSQVLAELLRHPKAPSIVTEDIACMFSRNSVASFEMFSSVMLKVPNPRRICGKELFIKVALNPEVAAAAVNEQHEKDMLGLLLSCGHVVANDTFLSKVLGTARYYGRKLPKDSLEIILLDFSGGISDKTWNVTIRHDEGGHLVPLLLSRFPAETSEIAETTARAILGNWKLQTVFKSFLNREYVDVNVSEGALSQFCRHASGELISLILESGCYRRPVSLKTFVYSCKQCARCPGSITLKMEWLDSSDRIPRFGYNTGKQSHPFENV